MKVFFLYSVLLSAFSGLCNANTKLLCTVPDPQGRQFCVYHICRLKGVPVTLAQIMEIFPPKEEGDSLLDLSDALEKLGFQCIGKKLTFEELLKEPFPLIAYFRDSGDLSSIGHFVVVEEASPKRIKVFYGNSHQRGTMSYDQFIQHWGGVALIITDQTFIWRPSIDERTSGKPMIRFDTLFLDAGDIPQGKEEVIFCFPFQNTGEADLILEGTATSCDCVMVLDDYKKNIPPGCKETLTAVYKFTEARGRFSHSVWVKSNDPYYPTIELSLNGNGLRDVFINPVRLNYDEVIQGQKETRQCIVQYDGDFLLEIRSVKSQHSYLSAEAKRLTPKDIQDTLPQGKPLSLSNLYNKYLLNVTIDTAALDVGEYHSKIEIETNISDNKKIAVPVHARVISPLRILPSKLFLGEIQAGSRIEKTISIRSLKENEIRIISIDTRQTKIESQYPKEPATCMDVKFTGVIDHPQQIEGKSIEIILQDVSTGKKIRYNLPLSGVVRQK